MDSFLQRSEIGQTGLVRNDSLAVDDRILDLELSRSFDETGKFARPVGTGFGENSNIPGAVDDDLDTVAVELDLVNPVVTLGRLGDQLGLHRPNELEPAAGGTYNFTHLFDVETLRDQRIGQIDEARVPSSLVNPVLLGLRFMAAPLAESNAHPWPGRRRSLARASHW